MVVDLAGVEPEEVAIEVTERTVSLSGARPRPPHGGSVSYRQMEIEYGSFQRR